MIDALKVKQQNEAKLKGLARRLPILETSTRTLRPLGELKNRALVLNAVIDLAYGWPADQICAWVEDHQLQPTKHEQRWLEGKRVPKEALRWSGEALWALMWAGRLHDSLEVRDELPDTAVKLCPDVRRGEGPEKFMRMRLRTVRDVFEKLDLYYRASFRPKILSPGVAYERRKALEWLMDPTQNWDDMHLPT